MIQVQVKLENPKIQFNLCQEEIYVYMNYYYRCFEAR